MQKIIAIIVLSMLVLMNTSTAQTDWGFRSLPLPDGINNIRTVDFINENIGYVYGDNGELWLTENGGNTYNSIYSGNLTGFKLAAFELDTPPQDTGIAIVALSGNTILVTTSDPQGQNAYRNFQPLQSFDLFQRFFSRCFYLGFINNEHQFLAVGDLTFLRFSPTQIIEEITIDHSNPEFTVFHGGYVSEAFLAQDKSLVVVVEYGNNRSERQRVLLNNDAFNLGNNWSFLHRVNFREKTKASELFFANKNTGRIGLDPISKSEPTFCFPDHLSAGTRNGTDNEGLYIYDTLLCSLPTRNDNRNIDHFTNDGGATFTLKNNGNATVPLLDRTLSYAYEQDGIGLNLTFFSSRWFPYTKIKSVFRSFDGGTNKVKTGEIELLGGGIVTTAGRNSVVYNNSTIYYKSNSPDAFTNVKANFLQNNNVKLSWSLNNVDGVGANLFTVVERKTPQGDFIPLDTLGERIKSCNDQSINDADLVSYAYRLRLIDRKGEQLLISNTVTYPRPATNLALAQENPNNIVLTWEDDHIEWPSDEYLIQRATNENGVIGRFSTIGATASKTFDLPFEGIQQYTFRVSRLVRRSFNHVQVVSNNTSINEWNLTTTNDNILNKIYSATNNSVWAVGTSGEIVRSFDNGFTWVNQISPTNRQLFDVFMVNAEVGFIVGDEGVLLKTLNAGQDWILSNPVSEKLASVHFLNTETGIIGGNAGVLATTNDGGINWNRQNFQDFVFFDTHVTQNNTFFAAGFGGILKSNDNGQNFTSSLVNQTDSIKSIHFVDSVNGFAAGYNGVFYKTTDAGENWTANFLADSINLIQIDFSTQNHGFAITQSGNLLRTNDGGNSWQTITLDNGNSTGQSVSFFNNGEKTFAIAKQGFTSAIYSNLIFSAPTAPILESQIRYVASNALELNWTAQNLSTGNFLVQRALSSAPTNFETVATLNSNTFSFVDATVSQHSIYVYRIVAQNERGETASNEVTSTLCFIGVPTFPLTINTALCNSESVTLTGDANNDIDGYVWTLTDTNLAVLQLGDSTSALSNTLTIKSNISGSFALKVRGYSACFGDGPEKVFIINANPPINVTSFVSPVNLNSGTQGSIIIEADYINGNNFSFTVNGETKNNLGLPVTFNNLAAATYNVKIENNAGCRDSIDLTIDYKSPLEVRFERKFMLLTRYEIALKVREGTPPYSVNIDGSLVGEFSNKDTLIWVNNGNRTITVVDANNNETSQTMNLSFEGGAQGIYVHNCDPASFSVNVLRDFPEQYNNPLHRGTFTVSGAGNFLYSVDSGYNYAASSIPMLAGESYIPMVKNIDNDCEYIIDPITIPELQFYKIELKNVIPRVNCGSITNSNSLVEIGVFENSTGNDVTNNIEASSSFNIPYLSVFNTTTNQQTNQFTFNNGVLRGLATGDYGLTVLQNNNPTIINNDTVFFTIADTVNENLSVQATTIQPTTCSDAENGELAFKITNGYPPFNLLSFNSNFDTTAREIRLTNLPDTAFNFTITDAQGCQAYPSYTLNSPVASVSNTALQFCFDDSLYADVQILGATDFYRYSLDSGQTILNYGVNKDTLLPDFFGALSLQKINRRIFGLKPGNNRIDFYSTKSCAFTTTAFIQSFVPKIEAIPPTCTGAFGAIKIDQGFEISYNNIYLWQSGVVVDSVTGLSDRFQQIAYFKNLTPNTNYQLTGEGNPFNPSACDLNEFVFIPTTDTALEFEVSVQQSSCPLAMDAAIQLSNINNNSFNVALYEATPNDTSVFVPAEQTAGKQFSNLQSGEYLIKIVGDTLGTCSVDLPVKIDTIELDFDVLLNVVDPSCNGDSTGELALTIVGADNESFLFSIDDGASFTPSLPNNPTFYFNDLTAGNYIVVVKDASDCRVQRDTVRIIEPTDKIELDVLVDGGSCYGDSSAIALAVTGGVPSAQGYLLSYVQNGVISSLGFNDSTVIKTLNQSAVQIIVSDSGNCQVIDTVQIDLPESIVASATTTDLTCPLGSDGTISIEALGGLNPFTFSLNNTDFQNDSVFQNLSSGNFSAYVKDANGCIDSTNNLTINEPLNTPQIAINALQPINAQNDFGSVDFTFANPSLPATFYLDSSTVQLDSIVINSPAEANNMVFDSLNTGSFVIRAVAPNYGCAVPNDTFEIRNEGVFSLTATFTQPISCNGVADAIVELNLNRSADAVTYYENDLQNALIGNTATDLAAGNYTFYAIVNSTDTLSTIINITEPDAIQLTALAVNGACFGENGFATVATNSADLTEFTWLLNGISIALNADSLNDLVTNDYTLIATNTSNCADTVNFSIQNPSIIELSLIGDTLICSDTQTMRFSITATGGADTYDSIFVNNTSVQAYGADVILANVAQKVVFGVTDANGCRALSDSVELVDARFVAQYDTVRNPNCFGEGSGAIQLDLVPANAAYEISVNDQPFQTSNGVFNDLILGTYSFEIKNSSGCVVELQDTVLKNPAQLVLNLFGLNSPNCAGSSDGSANISITGGTGAYSLTLNQSNWTAFNTTSISNLAAGNYTAEASDALGCSSNAVDFQIQQFNGVNFEANFLLPDTIGTGDYVRLIELIEPQPDSLIWTVQEVNQTFSGDTLLHLDSTGVYNINLTGFFNSCTSTIAKEINVIDGFVVQILDTNNYNANAILNATLLPNPTIGQATLTVEFAENSEMLVTIYSSTGVILNNIVSPKSTNQSVEMDFSTYSPGTYYVHFKTPSGLMATKLIVVTN